VGVLVRVADALAPVMDRKAMDAFFTFLRRFPFTLFMIAGLALAALLTNTYFEQITHHWLNRTGFAPDDLWYWRLERLFSSAFVTYGGAVFWEALFFVAFSVGLAEWMVGWKRTAITFWGVHLVVLVLLSVAISLAARQLPNTGLEAVILARDVGPSAGYFACLGLVSSRLKYPWNWASGGLLLLVFSIAFFVPPGAGASAEATFSANLAHLLAFPLGWLSGHTAPTHNHRA
jgi:hypothetical protein